MHSIGELDKTTARELMEQLTEQQMTADDRSIEDEMKIFAAEQSVRAYAVEWIKKSWAESPEKDPKVFASEILDDFMTTLD
jgi:hypothetical protein